MGLFQHKPEDPTEWAGLPSEPLEPLSAAERLDDGPKADALTLGDATSLTIPLPSVEE